jgi:hypothetical protein
MDISLKKIELAKKLLATENVSILESIKELFEKEEKDWWHELTEEQQNILNESMEEYERGEFSSFDDFIKPHLK